MSTEVRIGFWQNGFFADFIFGPPDFFADFVAGFIFLIFVGKKCPEKSSRKIPGKILQNLNNKNPRHISAEGPGQQKSANASLQKSAKGRKRALPRKICKQPGLGTPQSFPDMPGRKSDCTSHGHVAEGVKVWGVCACRVVLNTPPTRPPRID